MRTLTFFLILFCYSAFAQNIWDCSTYPDEAGFQNRMKPMLQRIAAKPFAQRSLAPSKCPDTGLPVKTWAVKGETIVSPYTGRAYLQGDTGYFGPKKRNEEGEIVAFGGDPLKYELSPAAANMLLGSEDAAKALAFLSIPGNLRQQYHFACSNWSRAYPLLQNQLSDAWKADFYHWIDVYREKRRPSDGAREHNDMTHAHDLVGQEGELLGGNAFDGGTENHKTMWRTSALLYSQLLPDTAKISGYSLGESLSITKKMISDYLKKMMYVGNGEYDSKVYYPYSIKSFMNLYDFSTDPEIKELAKLALDLYFVTYGLKVVDGAIAGAQKRGYLTDKNPDMMEIMQWAFFNDTSRDMEEVITTLHQSTTTYRPNKVIWNIVRKKLEKPFESQMSRPFYHMDHPHAFAETFYCSENFAMGNMQMTIVDNPNQQMVWSAVARGEDGPLCFSGGHPMRGSTSGHSPYTQTLQSSGTLILLTAPTQRYSADTSDIAKTYKRAGRDNLWIMPRSEQPENYEYAHRQKYASNPLTKIDRPMTNDAEDVQGFWYNSKGSASSWFYFPKQLKPQLINGVYFIEAHNTLLAVNPLFDDHYTINPDQQVIAQLKDRQAKKFFEGYGLIVFPGLQSGYVVEIVEKDQFKTIETFAKHYHKKTKLDLSEISSNQISYKSLNGDRTQMQYVSYGLRCKGIINGKKQSWDDFTGGAVYKSPYLSIKDGIMQVSDGEDGYVVDFTGSKPVWKVK